MVLRRVAEAQDSTAFAALFAHFGPRVKAYLMKSGADATTAEECAQDVMVTVWRKAAQFDPHARFRRDLDIHHRAQPPDRHAAP